MERDYHLQHDIILERFFNKAHDFELWWENNNIIKNFILNEYEKLSNATNKCSEKDIDWINIDCVINNKLHYIIIDFGEYENVGFCSKIILTNYKRPRYFTVERGRDYLYYLCEWTRGNHKSYFSVINEKDYILERISTAILHK